MPGPLLTAVVYWSLVLALSALGIRGVYLAARVRWRCYLCAARGHAETELGAKSALARHVALAHPSRLVRLDRSEPRELGVRDAA